jgi:hypothetical protein
LAFEQEVWDAFLALSSSRNAGMALGGIPFSELLVYWRDFRGVLDPDELEDVIYLTRTLDASYLASQKKD